jgi:hypothetical protein
MHRIKPLLLWVAVCLAVLLAGCGSSSQSPTSPLSITSTSALPQGLVNSPYSATLRATGGLTPYTWNVASGSLPPGLSLSRAGALSGTPSASGSFSFSVTVADAEHPPSVANANFPVTIAPASQVSTTSLPNGSPGIFYTATLAATGGIAPYSWTIAQGTLPAGLTLNATSGVISGTPTSARTSTFTVQASDSESPAATASTDLSIAINPPPPRSAALYVDQSKGPAGNQRDQTGLQILADGSLTLLPSSPETVITGGAFGSSPTLPLLFFIENGPPNYLKSLLVNPDYSLASLSSVALQDGSSPYARPVVDPTGSNLYLPGPIDANNTLGITIYQGNGSLQALSSIAIPNVTYLSSVAFTPDGTLAFVSTCTAGNYGSINGNILSYSRSPDGTLTSGPVNVLPLGVCLATVLTVSPDGRYLATGNDQQVQVYSIASDGTLTAILPQPFLVSLIQNINSGIPVADMKWDQSSAFLLVSTAGTFAFVPGRLFGGLAVLSFSGNALTETTYPGTGVGTGRILRVGSRVYAMNGCYHPPCSAPLPGVYSPYGIVGFDFQNGQLVPLPGSPDPYGNGGDIVIY